MTVIRAALLTGGAGAVFGQQRASKTVRVAEGVNSPKGPMRFFAQFIITKAGVVVFDAPDPGLVKAILPEIRKMTTQTGRYLIYRHNH